MTNQVRPSGRWRRLSLILLVAALAGGCGTAAPAGSGAGLDPKVREACHAVQLHPQAREIKRTEVIGVAGQMPEWQITYQVNGAGPREVYAFLSEALTRQGWQGVGFMDGVTSLATVTERGQAEEEEAVTRFPELAATRPGLAYVVGVEAGQPGAPLTVRIRCQDRQAADGVRVK